MLDFPYINSNSVVRKNSPNDSWTLFLEISIVFSMYRDHLRFFSWKITTDCYSVLAVNLPGDLNSFVADQKKSLLTHQIMLFADSTKIEFTKAPEANWLKMYQKTINLEISWAGKWTHESVKREKNKVAASSEEDEEVVACDNDRVCVRVEVERHDKFNVLLIKTWTS